MNLKEMIKNGSEALFVVSGSDLKEFALSLIAEAAAKPVETEEKYLGVSEVCELLNVSSNTLWRWNRIGYLPQIRIGRTPMYKKSVIDKLLKGA